MTKPQKRDVARAQFYIQHNMADCAARMISMHIRCAMRDKDIKELRVIAAALGLTNHPEFVC